MIEYRPATPADDADLRRLLRANAMPSWVTMSLEREPSFFAGANRFGIDHAFIARRNGEAAGMYVGSEHEVHVNGLPARIGYLGGLRIDPAFRHSLRNLRDGFASIRALAQSARIPFWYTSIAAGNRPARRLLEAQLAGIPEYRPTGEMLSLALSRTRGRRLTIWRPPGADEVETMCAFHNRIAARQQFSPVLTPDFVHRGEARFFVRTVGGRIDACMALWNQQDYKQTMIRGYRRPLALAIPLYNAWACLAGRVRLPKANHALDQSYLAFLAVEPQEASGIVPLIRDALSLCETSIMVVGVGASDPSLESLRKAFAPAEYRSVIHVVSHERPPVLDDLPVRPEVAIL